MEGDARGVLGSGQACDSSRYLFLELMFNIWYLMFVVSAREGLRNDLRKLVLGKSESTVDSIEFPFQPEEFKWKQA